MKLPKSIYSRVSAFVTILAALEDREFNQRDLLLQLGLKETLLP
jgi:hypothetical protein